MLRTFTQADIPQVLAIENAVHAAPWTEGIFKTCFLAGYFGWVLEYEGRLIGFIIVSIQLDECHILNLGVAREYQRQGWGRQLLTYALQVAKEKKATVAYLEVRKSNSRAISLYRKMDFHLVGERKGYYVTVAGNEDALVLEKVLG